MISVISTSPAWWEIKLSNKILASSTWFTCRSYVIGAVIFQPRGQSLTITSFSSACHQHTSHAQCNSCVASDKVKTGKRRRHLCNFTLLPHVHASFVLYAHLSSVCVDLFLLLTPLKYNPRKMSGSMYLFVFCVFARIMVPVNLWLPVYSYGCAEELPIQHKRKLQKHIPEKSTAVWVRCEENLVCCCCVNILDFKGNTAGAQRGIILIGHRLSFSLCIETCADRYTYIDTIQAKHTPHTGWMLTLQWRWLVFMFSDCSRATDQNVHFSAFFVT